MVVGLETFKNYFKDFQDAYLIIGGTACDILMEEAGFVPRATDDIDIILIIEAIKPEFIESFWRFIERGDYESKEYNNEKRNSYRFYNPATADFPKQLELFCKTPDTITLNHSLHLTLIPSDGELSNLSAILLDEDYYHFTIAHSTLNDDVHFANVESLICLKAFAYLDNKKRYEAGENVRKRDVIKHKYDIFRMAFLMPPETRIELPAVIAANLQSFVDETKTKMPPPDIFKTNGLGLQDMEKLLNQIIIIFGLK